MEPRKVYLRHLVILMFCGVIFFLAGGTDAGADLETPKLVYLMVDGDVLIASNIRFSRFDEFRLAPEEAIQRKSVGDAVAVIVTNERIIAYSALMASWRPIRYTPGESLETLEVEDFSASIITSRRFLNFNGRNGLWAERLR